MKLFHRLSEELFEPSRKVELGELLHFRLFELFIVIYAVSYSWSWGIYATYRNTDVVLPLGIANYFDISIFFDNHLAIINAAFISILLVTAFFRKGPRWLCAIAMVLFHLQYVIRYSQGEIPHSQNLVGLSVLMVGIGMIFYRSEKSLSRFVFGAVVFFIGLGYTSAFFSKLIGTGIHWFDGHHLWLWISEKSIDILSREGIYETNILQQLALQHVHFASLILLTGWLIELVGFTMWWKKLRPYTTTLLIAMHFGITLTMNIRFDAFVLQLIIIGYPWYKIFNYYAHHIPKPVQKFLGD